MNLRLKNFCYIPFAFLLGCSGWVGAELARSPDARVHLFVDGFEAFPGQYQASLEIQTSSYRKRVVDISKVRVPFRYEVFWGNNQVGILICKGDANVSLNIDPADGSYLEFDKVRNKLVAQILQKYRPTSADVSKFGSDPLEWFCGDLKAEGLPTFRNASVD